MGTYTPSTWVNNQQPALNATNLNNIEAGVSQAHEELNDLVIGTSTEGNPTSVAQAKAANHAVTVDKATMTTVGGVKIWVDSTDPANIIGYIDAR